VVIVPTHHKVFLFQFRIIAFKHGYYVDSRLLLLGYLNLRSQLPGKLQAGRITLIDDQSVQTVYGKVCGPEDHVRCLPGEVDDRDPGRDFIVLHHKRHQGILLLHTFRCY